jgi:hypothetical protein
VAELNSPEDLEHVASCGVAREALRILLQLLQHGVVHILKDEEELPATAKHFDQVDQVLVAETL